MSEPKASKKSCLPETEATVLIFFHPLWVFFNKSGSVVMFLLTTVLALCSQKCFWCARGYTVQGGGKRL